MILFYSDYLEGCHPTILERLRETNFEQTPGYGNDEYCDRAKERIKRFCNCPDAYVHFLVGGTQTNATVISSILRPFQGVLCADTGHINVHETGAIEHSGHKVLALPSKDGKVSASVVRRALEAHFSESTPEHEVQPGMLYVSLPTELGTLYSKNELGELKQVCSEWNIPLFIDGARLGYGLASPECDIELSDLPSLCDVFYIGGTKQGALFGEAVVISNPVIAKDFRYSIKQGGGLLAKGRLLGLQFDALFSSEEESDSFKNTLYYKLSVSADDLALKIKKAFREAGCDFLVDSQTNQQFPILDKSLFESLSNDFGLEFWKEIPSAGGDARVAVRICTSWATKVENVDALIDRLTL